MRNRDLFDRNLMTYFPLEDRLSKVSIETAAIDPDEPVEIPEQGLQERIRTVAQSILRAKERGSSVVCAFGAHTIKNGLGLVLGRMIEHGWVTHLATNGAGVIHDWEFSFLGKSSEDVRKNVLEGKFGTWEETGFFINLGLAVGAYQGMGYGESVGSMICANGLFIPEASALMRVMNDWDFSKPASLSQASAAADLLEISQTFSLKPGFLNIPHPFGEYSIQKVAFDCGVPFTSHPMFGHDIIYTHKANRGSVIGRTAERDFLSFAHSVAGLDGGVYLSVGSAVMSPMIFEKSLSMARNVLAKEPGNITDVAIYVVDLQESTWDWRNGEPPMDNPAYYLRFMKSFNRMGCRESYISADNRTFLVGLLQELQHLDSKSGVGM